VEQLTEIADGNFVQDVYAVESFIVDVHSNSDNPVSYLLYDIDLEEINMDSS